MKFNKFNTDDRAISELLGAILVFALVLVLIVLAQVTLVPALNQQVEYEHNLRAQDDLLAVQDSFTRVSSTGAPESVSVEAGVTYPNRPFLLNPGPVTGTVSTEAAGTPVVISGFTTSNPETADYWNGSRAGNYETRILTYAPNYNELRSPGTVVLENGVYYRQFDDAFDTAVVTGEQVPIVQGNKITIVTVTGDVNKVAEGPTGFSITPTSAPAQQVAIENVSGGNINIVAPTRLSQADWNSLVENEPNVQTATVDTAAGTVTLVLRPGTYELGLSQVTIGSTTPAPGKAAYLTRERGFASIVPVGGGEVSVEVRDAFNNPVSGVAVNFATATAGVTFEETGTKTAVSTSDEDGRATVTVVAGTDGTAEVEAFIPPTGVSGPDTRPDNGRVDFEEILFDIQVGSGGGGGGDDDGEINPNAPGEFALVDSRFYGCTGGGNQCNGAEVTFEALAASKTITDIRMNYYQTNDPGNSKSAAVSLGSATIVAENGVALGSDEIVMDITGPYVDASVLNIVTSGSTVEYRITFLTNGPPSTVHQPQGGDQFGLTIRFDDGSRSTYVVNAYTD